jgi:hypothetical protein
MTEAARNDAKRLSMCEIYREGRDCDGLAQTAWDRGGQAALRYKSRYSAGEPFTYVIPEKYRNLEKWKEHTTPSVRGCGGYGLRCLSHDTPGASLLSVPNLGNEIGEPVLPFRACSRLCAKLVPSIQRRSSPALVHFTSSHS